MKPPSPSYEPVVEAEEVAPEEEKDLRPVIFRPNPGPQTDFLGATERQVLYGGATGGGKSFAMLADPVRYFGHPKFNGLLLRRTTEELRELIRESKGLYDNRVVKGKWNERDKTWTFPSGAQLWMSFLDRDADTLRYQGQAFSWVGFDELTQWPTPYPWNYLSSRLRTTAKDLPLSQRASTNPGGPGHCLPYGEVLTSSGWVDIKDVKVGDTVLSVKKSGEIIYTKVSDTVKEFYKGVMVKREGRGLTLEFTENHRLPIKTEDGFKVDHFYNLAGQVNVLRAGSLFTQGDNNPEYFEVPVVEVRKAKLEQPKKILYKDYMELLGWFLSEGHTVDRDKEFGISQVKQHQRVLIEDLLIRCGFSYRSSSLGFSISCPNWYSYFYQFGKCRDKFIPREALSGPYLEVLFKSLMGGDGHWTKNGGCYYTISKALADQFSELVVKLGYSAYLVSRQRANRKGLSYEVSFTNRKTTELNTGNHLYKVNTSNQSTNIVKTQFEGYVYCITVPETEVFFVRQNGCVWLSGNSWVKKMFVDPSPPGKAFWATDIETGEIMRDAEEDSPEFGKPLFRRRFIPAALKDNPYLATDGDYKRTLMALPENQRKQFLYGNWDVAEGSAFTEWNRNIHVIEPFDIPSNWTKFRSCDYGYGSYTAVLWFAVEPKTEKLIVYRELYVSKMLAVDLADTILDLERYDGMIRYGVLDSSLWHKRGDPGPSLAEQMIARGCRWRPSDRSKGSRVAGKNEVHKRLQVDEWTEEPRIQFFDTCVNAIAQIPTIPLDKSNPEDVDTSYEHDHIYDALRYGVMSRPRSIFDFDNTLSSEGFAPADSIFGYINPGVGFIGNFDGYNLPDEDLYKVQRGKRRFLF